MGKLRKDIVPGSKFGRLTLDERIWDKKRLETFWFCTCECGAKKSIRQHSLVQGKTESCGCLHTELLKTNAPKPQTVGKITSTIFARIRRRAIGKRRKNKMKFNITKEYLWNLYLSQDGKCALTGDPIDFEPCYQFKGRGLNKTASIDRIDCNQGYIEGNLRWVHLRANIMRQDMDDDGLYEWCEKILNRRNQNGQQPRRIESPKGSDSTV